MLKTLARYVVLAVTLLPPAAVADPIKLKFSYYTSDREIIYRSAVKPFVDSVNAAANGLIQIEVFLSGALGKSFPGQAQLVLDGGADFAVISPGLSPDLFPDDAVIELPGLFRDLREASLVYTRIAASGALRGNEQFFVVLALAAGPQFIHTRPPIASLNDLRDKKIRATNRIEGAVLKALGMVPEVIPIIQTSEAIGRGTIDGATVSPIALVEYGIGRVASHHYFLQLGSVPLLLVMNKAKFDSLPAAAQDVIRKYSGEWLATRHAERVEADNNLTMDQLKPDPKRKVIFPSQPDLDTAQAAFKAVTEQWLEKSPRNRELFTSVQNEIVKVRADH
jgi:TRAP-type C4-dicarboxylate transport system substrate-binding protein